MNALEMDNHELAVLLAKYADLPDFVGVDLKGVSQKGNFGNCPLHIAAVRGKLDEVELLLTHGALINLSGEGGYSPLHSAVESGKPEVVKLLISRGADLHARDENGQTPADLARSLGKLAVVELFKS